jgi:hypothetical protein
MNNLMRPRTSSWLPASCLLALLVTLVLSGFGASHASRLAGATLPTFSSVVHWHDAGHDWLLVGDGQSNQLSVYDAVDGRLVRRVAVQQGLNDAASLAQRDGRLYVVGDDGQLGELRLPQLQLVAANGP